MARTQRRMPAAIATLVAAGIAGWFWLQARPSPAEPHPVDATTAAAEAKPATEIAKPAAERPASKGKRVRQPTAQIAFASWGGKADQLGRERPAEGNAVGPMSFGVDGRGRVHVLDNVNGRLVTRAPDGSQQATVFLDAPNPEDLAVADDGSVAVLDRHRDKAVSLYDEHGKTVGKLPLEGDGVPDRGEVTGVFVDGKDVYVEKEHGPLVKLGTLGGMPAEPRSEIPGRPSRDGLSFLNAGITDASQGRIYVASIERASGQHRFTRELRLAARVGMIVLLDTDRHGTIYVAAEVEATDAKPSVRLHCLDATTGEPVGSAVLPANTLPEESFRDYVVLADGGVVQALRTEQGVSYTRHDCM